MTGCTTNWFVLSCSFAYILLMRLPVFLFGQKGPSTRSERFYTYVTTSASDDGLQHVTVVDFSRRLEAIKTSRPQQSLGSLVSFVGQIVSGMHSTPSSEVPPPTPFSIDRDAQYAMHHTEPLFAYTCRLPEFQAALRVFLTRLCPLRPRSTSSTTSLHRDGRRRTSSRHITLPLDLERHRHPRVHGAFW